MATEALVRGLMSGGPVAPIEGRGITNTKFRCERASGEAVVVRVNENLPPAAALGRFRKAAFCVRICEREGVPAPEVLDTGLLANGRPYSVERWVGGALPADLVRDEAARVRVWHDLGRLIRRVHAADLGGQQNDFALGYDGESPTATWATHLAVVQALLANDTTLGLSAAARSRLADGLERLDLAVYPPALNHGDLKLDNVLVDPDTFAVVAILDWELARFVPGPLGEYATSTEPAVLESKRFAVAGAPAEREAFLAGLGYGPVQARDFLLFALADVLLNVGWYERVTRSERPDVEILRHRFVNYVTGVRADVERWEAAGRSGA